MLLAILLSLSSYLAIATVHTELESHSQLSSMYTLMQPSIYINVCVCVECGRYECIKTKMWEMLPQNVYTSPNLSISFVCIRFSYLIYFHLLNAIIQSTENNRNTVSVSCHHTHTHNEAWICTFCTVTIRCMAKTDITHKNTKWCISTN